MAPFVDETRTLIVRTGIWAGVVTLLLGSLWVYWLMSPIGRLSETARKISAGERGVLQTGGVAELRELGKSLENMRDELEGRHYVESYVQALTHEIKSPLSAIQGAAELLEEKGEVKQAVVLLETTLAGSLAPESLRPVLFETCSKLKQQLPAI